MKQNTPTACVVCDDPHVKLWSKCKDYEYLSQEDEYTYFKCDSCKTIFIDPMPISKISEIYPPNYYSFADVKENLAMNIKAFLDKLLFKKVLKRISGDSVKVLDVGGGSGWLLNTIRDIDPRVDFTQVVDIDSNAKDLAIKNGHNYFQGTIEEYDGDQKFDLVLMLNLVEHISDPRNTLNKIEKMLNKGGLILIKTPNIESLDARLYQNSYWGGLHCPRHWILFSQNSFRHLLKDSNLNINYVKYTQGAPFWAWSVLIQWQRKGWVKISKERPVMFHPLIPLLHICFAGIDFVRGIFGSKTSQMFIEISKK